VDLAQVAAMMPKTVCQFKLIDLLAYR